MIPILLLSEKKEKAAYALSEKTSGTIYRKSDDVPKGKINIVFREDRVSLERDSLSLTADFSLLKKRIKKNNLPSESLIKAAKLKNMENASLIDATAGLGEDSFLLAAYGFTVTMFEYDPVIASLLSDALERGKEDPEISDIISRMTLIEGDSIEYMNNRVSPADVIFLDPMFPKREKSGLIKKKFQLLQELEKPCTDGDELLSAALNANPKKIIIKRPGKGPFLGERKPSYSINGPSVRFDVTVL